MWKLIECRFIVQFNDFVELPQYINQLANQLDASELSKLYPKKTVVPSNIVVSGVIPEMQINFFDKDDEKYENLKATTGVDFKTLTTIFLFKNESIDIKSFKEEIDKSRKLFLDSWDKFNAVAKVHYRKDRFYHCICR